MHAGETKNGWIDVSVSLHSGMVHWPDNPPVQIERALSIEHGDAANVSEISMGAHTGTHMDGLSISFERAKDSTRCRLRQPSGGRG